LWKRLDLQQNVELQVNTLGSPEARQQYGVALVGYLQQHFDQLDPDSQRRLQSNPLRILDSKDKKTAAIVAGAPQLYDFISQDDRDHFEKLCNCLAQLDIPFQKNPVLVRGLDYYNGFVFEWITNDLGSQGTLCAGGRYDGLVEKLGGKPTPGVGFAVGLERVVCILEQRMSCNYFADVYVMFEDSDLCTQVLDIARQLRESMSDLRVYVDLQGGALKKQFKRADKSGAHYAITVSDKVKTEDKLELTNLLHRGERQILSPLEVIEFIRAERDK